MEDIATVGVSGLRASGPQGLRADFLTSEQWRSAQRAIRAIAHRCGPSWLRDEAVDEAEMRVIEQVLRGEPIDNWVAYCAKLTRSVLRRLRHDEMARLDERTTVGPPRCSFDDLVASATFPLESLRGATQRRLASAVLSGKCCAEIAALLQWPEKEVRRQLLRLAAVVASRRKSSAPTATA